MSSNRVRDLWNCDNCDGANEGYATVCGGCGYPRPHAIPNSAAEDAYDRACRERDFSGSDNPAAYAPRQGHATRNRTRLIEAVEALPLTTLAGFKADVLRILRSSDA